MHRSNIKKDCTTIQQLNVIIFIYSVTFQNSVVFGKTNVNFDEMYRNIGRRV